MDNENVIINKTEKPNSFSFRYGGTGTDMKIYFDTAEDLERQLLYLSDKAISIKEKIAKIKEDMTQ